MEVTIYTLEDPISFKIKYVGITSSTLEERLDGHVKQAKYSKLTRKSGRERWILDLLSKNLLPIISEIETVNDDYGYIEEVLERYWMFQFKCWGFELLNIQGLYTCPYKVPYHVRARTPINQYDLNGNFIKRYESVSEATKVVNGQGSVIQRAAREKSGWKAYGFMWRYDKDITNTSNISPALSKLLPNENRPVLQYKDGILIKIWESGQQAAFESGLLKSKISNCCNGKRKTHGGYTWEFQDK